jgi:hypothetical protein
MTQGNFVWSWRDASFGAVIAGVGIAVIVTGHVEMGLPMLMGSLPAAVIGLLPTRTQRRNLVILGILFGSFLMLGSLIAQWALIAIPGMFLLAFGGSILASKRRFGMIMLYLCVPLAGVGLSYEGLENSVNVGLLLIIGSIVAFGWSLCFKEYKPPIGTPAATANPQLFSNVQAQNYGIRLGLTAAISTAIGFLLGVDHMGWIVGASLFVMRPSEDVHKSRSIWRMISVFLGASAASLLLTLNLPPFVIGSLAGGALIAAAATHRSRRYITPIFSTFLVFWLLLYTDPTYANIAYRFNERILETLIGIGIAFVFGIAIPKLISRPRSSR